MTEEVPPITPLCTSSRLRALLSAMKNKSKETKLLCDAHLETPSKQLACQIQQNCNDESSEKTSLSITDKHYKVDISSNENVTGFQVRDAIEDASKEQVDETIYDYKFYVPKTEETNSCQNNSFHCPYNNEHEKSVCDEHSLKHHAVNGDIGKDFVLPESKEGNPSVKIDEDLYNSSNPMYGQQFYTRSIPFENDNERNEVYDKWMCDLVTWERNRLTWLDKVGMLEGFDSYHDKDRTFLVKIDRGQANEESPTNNNLVTDVTSIMTDDNKKCSEDDYSEARYRLERLQSHQSLHDISQSKYCVNTLEDLDSDDVEVISCSSNDEQQSFKNSDVKINPRIPQMHEDKDATSAEFPHDVVLVYQFTDRNLWQKYRHCFKKGKFF